MKTAGKNNHGFTLFEAILVITLLIIVIALGAPQVKGEKEWADSRAPSAVPGGGETPQVTRVIDYSKDYPSSYIFNGFWELDPSKLRDSSKLTTTTPSPIYASSVVLSRLIAFS